MPSRPPLRGVTSQKFDLERTLTPRPPLGHISGSHIVSKQPRKMESFLTKHFDAEDTLVATSHPTGYQLFIHENKNCAEVLACTPGPERFKKLGSMWQALKNVPVKGQADWNEMALTISFPKKPSKVSKEPVARRQTGYQLFIHENKNCAEVLACTPGHERFRKLGSMWHALKDVPVKGQAYWNERALAL
jgi:hypothetical protein